MGNFIKRFKINDKTPNIFANSLFSVAEKRKKIVVNDWSDLNKLKF